MGRLARNVVVPMTQLPEGKQWVKTAAVRSCNEVKVADVSCDGCDDEDLSAPVEVGTLQAVELEESTWSLHLCDCMFALAVFK